MGIFLRMVRGALKVFTESAKAPPPPPVIVEPVKPAAKVEPAPFKMKRWRWDNHTTIAHTKSEARSQFKKKLGLDRLPIGANVVQA